MAGATGKTLTPSQKIAWLRLIRSENVGPVTFRQLVSRTGSVEQALADLPNLASRVGVGGKVTTIAQAEDEIAAIERIGGRLVACDEPGYPALLAHISAAPPLLSIVGGENLEFLRTVAIVGARNASAAGQRMTELLAGDLSAHGYVVVSGLARGIDAAAHKGALAVGGGRVGMHPAHVEIGDRFELVLEGFAHLIGARGASGVLRKLSQAKVAQAPISTQRYLKGLSPAFCRATLKLTAIDYTERLTIMQIGKCGTVPER